jgi:hypothetical protein
MRSTGSTAAQHCVARFLEAPTRFWLCSKPFIILLLLLLVPHMLLDNLTVQSYRVGKVTIDTAI